MLLRPISNISVSFEWFLNPIFSSMDTLLSFWTRTINELEGEKDLLCLFEWFYVI